MLIRVKKTHPEAVVPTYAHPGDSGFDLVAIEDVIIEPGQTVKVRTGLAFEIPSGYELQIRPRSGISFRTSLRISNSPATIDSNYRGEVAVLIENTAPISDFVYPMASDLDDYDIEITGGTVMAGTYLIRKGDRIAQGVICPVYHAEFTEVDDLGETERGDGGFGSSGTTTE